MTHEYRANLTKWLNQNLPGPSRVGQRAERIPTRLNQGLDGLAFAESSPQKIRKAQSRAHTFQKESKTSKLDGLREATARLQDSMSGVIDSADERMGQTLEPDSRSTHANDRPDFQILGGF